MSSFVGWFAFWSLSWKSRDVLRCVVSCCVVCSPGNPGLQLESLRQLWSWKWAEHTHMTVANVLLEKMLQITFYQHSLPLSTFSTASIPLPHFLVRGQGPDISTKYQRVRQHLCYALHPCTCVRLWAGNSGVSSADSLLTVNNCLWSLWFNHIDQLLPECCGHSCPKNILLCNRIQPAYSLPAYKIMTGIKAHSAFQNEC